ncbi:MAG: anaerobic ribonucleoside-triphosphate reductase activating protein [Candidatus Portnoybacteria bacterium]|nr:anaerobic ribonucleoside-triphosphate reductase activating protein [Candidatus Portnoybacteria bacterium]
MLIGGLQKMTLIDYPGKVAATVFTIGCNFNCSFCHNPELVDKEKIKKQPMIKEKVFFEFLESRKNLLEGICITGGEPTIQNDLADFARKIKEMGFLVKLDTNGSRPKVLARLLKNNLLDFVAMDIKSSSEKYCQVAGKFIKQKDILESVDLIKNSGKEYEFRTTALPGLIDKEDIRKIGQLLKGAKLFVLQPFKMDKNLNGLWRGVKLYSEDDLKEMLEIARQYFYQVELRGV